MTNSPELIDIENSFRKLKGVFHNEHHLKMEFGLLLNKLLEDQGIEGAVIPEWKTEQSGKVDLAIRTKRWVIPIEMKYKRSSVNVHDTRYADRFSVSSHHDYQQGMYSFIQDISNLESLTTEYDTYGYAIFLTNTSNYWSRNQDTEAVYDVFRIYEGRVLEGKLDCRDKLQSGHYSSYEKIKNPIHLENQYKLSWDVYSYSPDIRVEGADEFRVLIVRVPPNLPQRDS